MSEPQLPDVRVTDRFTDTELLDWLSGMPNERMNRAVDIWRADAAAGSDFRDAIVFAIQNPKWRNPNW